MNNLYEQQELLKLAGLFFEGYFSMRDFDYLDFNIFAGLGLSKKYTLIGAGLLVSYHRYPFATILIIKIYLQILGKDYLSAILTYHSDFGLYFTFYHSLNIPGTQAYEFKKANEIIRSLLQQCGESYIPGDLSRIKGMNRYMYHSREFLQEYASQGDFFTRSKKIFKGFIVNKITKI